MAENKLPFVEGASINKPTMFSGVNYLKIYLAEFKRGGELNFKRFLSI